MGYQPFLIAPFSNGLNIDQEPWIIPQDAFQEIDNAHIHNGVIERREGYSKLGDIVYQDQTNWKITAVTTANPGVVTMTDVTGLTNGDIIEIRNVTGMTELNGNRYTVANVTGGAGGTFELSGVDTSNFTAWSANGDVYLIPQNRVMGIYNRIDSTNVKNLIAFDQYRASLYNISTEQFDPLDSANIMSGSDTDYICAANWASTSGTAASSLFRLYFTNGKAFSAGPLDGIRFYNGGTTTTSFRPQINSSAYINGCKLIFAFRNRLVLLHTTEDSNTYAQRARWCQAGSPGTPGAFTTEWDDNVPGRGGFVDAPTGEQIISAQFLDDQLIVFFTNSVWSLTPIGDPDLPFAWRRINNFNACNGKMASVSFDRHVVSSGNRGLIATDGAESQRIDQRIEKFTNQFVNSDEFDKSFMLRSFANKRTWMLYASNDSSDCNKVLVFDEDSQSFSTYTMDMNVLGHFITVSDDTLQDFGSNTLQNFNNDTLQDYVHSKAVELLLGGDRTGSVWKMEKDGDNSSSDFSSSIIGITQANPAVVTMTGDVGLSNGDTITITSVAGMTELNNRNFIVANKSGNSFELQGVDSTAYTAYTSGGLVDADLGSDYETKIVSAGWNPFASEGGKSQLGYIDLYVDTNNNTAIEVKIYVNQQDSSYLTKVIQLDCLPNLREQAGISNITQANPAVISAGNHGLSTGDVVYLYKISGMDELSDGPYAITVIDGNTFSIAEDTTNFRPYINGGVVTRYPISQDKTWKRFYSGSVGFQHYIEFVTKGQDKPLRIHAFMPWFRKIGSRMI